MHLRPYLFVPLVVEHLKSACAYEPSVLKIQNWSGAMNQFAIFFEGQVPIAGLS
jgi:hypothetical protein